ncbi:MAG: hypothetical protein EXQ70_02000 [Solirubrobacterales bacterium]|nr:hypothetical protein [Solirubrobacterales bacterium]
MSTIPLRFLAAPLEYRAANPSGRIAWLGFTFDSVIDRALIFLAVTASVFRAASPTPPFESLLVVTACFFSCFEPMVFRRSRYGGRRAAS